MILQFLKRNADSYSDEPAIVFGEARISHRQLLSQVMHDANRLRELPVERGDRVALWCENSPAFVSCFFAIAANGGINVPLNTAYRDEELRFFLEDSGARAIIVDDSRIEAARRAARALAWPCRILSLADPAGGLTIMDESTESMASSDNGATSPDRDVIYIYSSGTTGQPKCIPRSARQYALEAESVCEALSITHEDAIFCAIPLFHNLGAVHCMLAAAVSGAKLVMLERINPFALRRRQALKLLEAERASILPCVPFVLEQLAAADTTADLSSLRLCYSAGAALQREVAQAFYDKYGVPIRQHYGCSEVGAMTIDLEGAAHVSSDCVGRPFPGVTLRMLDDRGEEAPPGAVSEITASAPQMTRGYLGSEEANAASFRDGAFLTGDLGYVDDSGRLYLRGRKRLTIDVAGQKVSPLEVENALARHPAVAASVVVGGADPHGSAQVVHAYVQLKANVSKDELFTYCREHLAFFKVPQRIEFVSTIPMNELGKIQRRADLLDQLIVKS